MFRIIIVVCLTLHFSSSAQVSDAEMDALRANWREELSETAHQKILRMPKKEGMPEFSDSIQRLFVRDTFLVENILRRQSAKEPSTLGINKAQLFCASEYDQLVDKYFAILQSKMKKEDAELLVSWQKEWRTLMNTEKLLVGRLMQEPYSGGGSIHSLVYTARLMNQNKNRLLTIIDYLTHMI